MEKGKKIFVVSWFFPPVNSSEGIVTYKLLNNSVNVYDVYTQKYNDAAGYVQTDLQCGSNINRIFCEKVGYQEFRKGAVKYYMDHRSEYDIVMTRAMPNIDHEIGLEIKKNDPEVFWIASFGDPIAENPYWIIENLKIKENSGKGIKSTHLYKSLRWKFYASQKMRRFQGAILDKSDAIIVNNPYEKSYIQSICKDADNGKYMILPHTYDEKLFPEPCEKDDRITFSFVGHLDKLRSPKRLFQAILRLKNEDPDLSSKVNFNFFGDIEESDSKYAIDNSLTDVIKFHGGVDYVSSLKIMKSSNWLIHIDADITAVTESNVFFAAKLADYIGSGNKIIGITTLNGAAYEILKNYGAVICEDITSQIYNYLFSIIYCGYSPAINECERKKYDVREVVRRFDELINEERNEQ